MIIIIGLGNPGTKYANHRHNVGFMVLNQFSGYEDLVFEENKIFRCYIAREGDLILAKPTTFMNDSGDAVRLLLREYPDAKLVVVYDEINIPLGEVKCSFGRGSGDHNGLQSIIDTLGHKDFFRIRVGVRPVHEELLPKIAPPDGFEKFLLSDFSPLEEKLLNENLLKAAGIIRGLRNGISYEEIMNENN